MAAEAVAQSLDAKDLEVESVTLTRTLTLTLSLDAKDLELQSLTLALTLTLTLDAKDLEVLPRTPNPDPYL